MIKRSTANTGLLDKLRAFVLLGGSVRPGRLGTTIGRLICELPLEAGCSILDSWRQEAQALAECAGHAISVRVMIDRAASLPMVKESSDASDVQIERDPFDYRGTGGVLRDLAAGYHDDDLLLVANAAQVMCEPITGLAMELAATRGDVSIVSHLDGVASGLMLMRCGALRGLPAHGFVDMKEQALPAIAAEHSVTVVHRQRPTALPIRTLEDYVDALRQHHKRLAGKAETSGAFAEDWEPSFAIVEAGASVDATARLQDSVVLAGGRVEAGAVLVQSIVCPGGVLRRGQMQVDGLVAPGSDKRSGS